MLRSIPALSIVFALALPVNAWALSCDEIANLQSLNVPTESIVGVVEGSGTKFVEADVKCLEAKGVDPKIIDIVRRIATASDEPEPEPVTPKSKFDEAEGLGGDIPTSDVPGTGESDDEGGGGPQQIEDLKKLCQAKKYLTCTKGLFDLLEDKSFPEQETEISYYLAKGLFDLGMYHSSQHYFMQVVRKGPKNPYFKHALPRLVQISQLTGDETELMRIVDKVPTEAFPRAAKNTMVYLAGRKKFEDEKYVEAASYFDQVSSKSDLYLRARYYEGVIQGQRKKLRDSVKAYKEVLAANITAKDAREQAELEAIKDLAVMNIARTYYGLAKFDDAEYYYSMVNRDSAYWPDSLFERGWTAFLQNDLNLTLGHLLTLRSPQFADEDYLPEATVLRALTFFQFCDFKESERILIEFEKNYKPMNDEIKAFLAQYNTEEASKLTDQAFDAYFDMKHEESKLSKSMFLRILRNRDLSDIVRHLDLLNEEDAKIEAQKGAWKDSIGMHLKKVIEEDRQRYKRKGGSVMLDELTKDQAQLSDLLSQAKVIRFEIVDAQRADYEFKGMNPDVGSKEARTVDFAIDPKWVYWPFNGEFWQDELGYYRYTETSTCK